MVMSERCLFFSSLLYQLWNIALVSKVDHSYPKRLVQRVAIFHASHSRDPPLDHDDFGEGGVSSPSS